MSIPSIPRFGPLTYVQDKMLKACPEIQLGPSGAVKMLKQVVNKLQSTTTNKNEREK